MVLDHLLQFRLQFVSLLLQFLERSAPFLGCIGRQLHPIQTEVCASQQIHLIAHQQNIAEQTLDLCLHRRDKMSQGTVIRTTVTAECHEENVLTASSLDLPRTE